MNNYYQPSGRFSLSSIPLLLVTCITVTPLLGLIYAYAIWYIPFIYINFLIAAGFGILIGIAVNYTVVGWGKVRNGKLAALFGLMAGLAGLYAHWCVWLDLVLNAGESYGNSRIGITVSGTSFSQALSLLFQPKSVMALVSAVNENGTWGIRGATVHGTFLKVIWFIEAAIVVGIPTLIVWMASKNPFMEKIEKWAKEKELPPFSFIDDAAGFKEALEKNDFGVLQNLKQISIEGDVAHSVFKLFYYPGHDEYYLSVENKIPKVDDKGKTSYESVEIVGNLSIDTKMGEMLINLKAADTPVQTEKA